MINLGYSARRQQIDSVSIVPLKLRATPNRKPPEGSPSSTTAVFKSLTEYAFVHLKVPASAGAVTIPSNALLFRSEGLRAGVVRNGRAVLRPISIGQDYGSAVEVLSGLTSNDAVILNPSDSLVDGAVVRVRTKTVDKVRP